MLLLAAAAIPFLFVIGQDEAAPKPDELRTAYNHLKAAEEKRDTDLTKQYAVECSTLARNLIKSPQPKLIDEVDAWKAKVEFAREVENYADYALYAGALRARERAKMIDLYDTLEKQTPNSEYLPKLYGTYAGALAQAGQAAKAYEFAGKAIAKDPSNEDLLMILADGAMARKQWDRAASFGTKLAGIMANHPRPEGVPAGDWEHKRTAMAGRGYYIAGLSYASLNKFSLADKNLRAAMPYLQGESQLIAAANFYLGLANYNLARATQDKSLMRQALDYSEQASKAGGAYGQSAAQNVYAIKQELSRWR